MKTGVPNWVATTLAGEWSETLGEDITDLDRGIAEIEAANLAQHYNRWHVKRLGTVDNPRPDGVFHILGGNLTALHP